RSPGARASARLRSTSRRARRPRRGSGPARRSTPVTSLAAFAPGERDADLGAQLRDPGALCQRILRLLALADVAHESAEQPRAADPNGRDRKLDGKLLSVAAHTGDLQTLVQERPCTGGEEVRQSALV